jgi:hypothetical protein
MTRHEGFSCLGQSRPIRIFVIDLKLAYLHLVRGR